MKSTFNGALLLTLVLVGCSPRVSEKPAPVDLTGQPGISRTVQVGRPAPDFEITDQNGKTFKLSDYRGKAVLIDFWAFWCSACVEEFEDLRKLNREFNGDGFAMIGLNADIKESPDKLSEGIKRSRLPWRQGILRKDSVMWADYDVSAYPTKIFVGPDGVVRWIDNFVTREQLAELIRRYPANR